MSLRARWRLLPVIVLIGALGGGIAFGLSSALPKAYRSETVLVVGGLLSPGPSYEDLLISQNLSGMYAQLATTRPIVEGAIDRASLDLTALDLIGRIEAEPTQGPFITLAVTDDSAGRAAVIANALAQELLTASPALTERQERAEEIIAADLRTIGVQIVEAEREIDELTAISDRDAGEQARLDRMRDRLSTLVAGRATLLSLSGPSTANVLTVVEEAVPAQIATAPTPTFSAALGVVAGLAISIAVIYLTRVRQPEPQDDATA